MLEVVASTAQQLRGNGNNITSATAQLYTAVLEKLDNLSKNVTTNNSFKEIFPTQSILTTVKPILPSVKNLPFTPAIPVRNIGDLEKNTTTGKTEDKISNTLLERINNIFDKFKDVKQQAASQTLLPSITTANAEKPSYIERKSRIEEDEDSIASDVKGIFNLLKKVFGEGGRISSGAEQNAASGSLTAAAGGPLGLATYFLLRKFGNNIKSFFKGKGAQTAETLGEEATLAEDASLASKGVSKALPAPREVKNLTPEGELNALKNTGKTTKVGQIIEAEVTPITETTKTLATGTEVASGVTKATGAVSGLAKVGSALGTTARVAGKVAAPLAVAGMAFEGYDLYKNPEKIQQNMEESTKRSFLGNVWSGISNPLTNIAGAAKGTYDIVAQAAANSKTIADTNQIQANIDEKLHKMGFKDQADYNKFVKEHGGSKGVQEAGGIKKILEQEAANKASNKDVKTAENKTEAKDTKPEAAKEDSVKEKVNIKDESSSVLKVIADNTNKTNASIQGLTAGIYKLAEAIAKNQGVKGSAPAISLSPNIAQDTQQTPSAVEYAAMYTSPGQQIRQKAFATYNK